MNEASTRRSKKKWWLLGGAGAIVLITGGVVAALWSASGSGNASDKALTAQTLTITAAATPTADLYPGASGALQFTVTNANPYPVSLTSMTAGTITSGDPTNCPSTNITVSGGTLVTPIAVPAAGTSAAISVPSKVLMAAAAPDGCQGVTFTIAITLTGAQT